MQGPLQYLVSERPTLGIQFESSLEEMVVQETSESEAGARRNLFGVVAGAMVVFSAAKGVTLLPEIADTISTPAPIQDINTFAVHAKEAAQTAYTTGVTGLLGWMGLEFGSLALKSHQRLQTLEQSDSL